MNVENFLAQLYNTRETESYWKAFENIFGNTAPIIKHALANDPAQRFNYASDTVEFRKRVMTGLYNIFPGQASIIEDLAKEHVAISEAREWENVFSELERADHAVHFCPPDETRSNMLHYLENSMKRANTKVVCLCKSGDIGQIKNDLNNHGFGKAVKSGHVGFIPYDPFMQNMISDGNVDDSSKTMQEQLDSYLDEGYSSIRFGGLLAGSLFSMGHYGLTKAWEAYLHRTAQKIDLTIYCPYPMPSDRVGFDALRNVACTHNWVASSGMAYRTSLASF